jgi:hypothetical protein
MNGAQTLIKHGLLYRCRTTVIGNMEFGNDRSMEIRKDLRKFLEITFGCIFFDHYNKPFINSMEETPQYSEHLNELRNAGNLNAVHEFGKQHRLDDLRIIDLVDFVIVHINPKIPTFGTIEELATANRMKKPIYILFDCKPEETPFWLTWMINPKYFYYDLLELKEELRKINSGENIDNDRWHLLKEEYK